MPLMLHMCNYAVSRSVKKMLTPAVSFGDHYVHPFRRTSNVAAEWTIGQEGGILLKSKSAANMVRFGCPDLN